MTSLLLLARVDYLHWLFAIPMGLLSVFLTLVILVQRGRGGGLTGALGGMGGQSAFGTKAGDLFTRITIVVAAIWVLLSMVSIKVLAQRNPLDSTQRGIDSSRTKAPVVPGKQSPTGPTTPSSTTQPPAAPAKGTTPAAPATTPAAPAPAAPAPATPANATPEAPAPATPAPAATTPPAPVEKTQP